MEAIEQGVALLEAVGIEAVGGKAVPMTVSRDKLYEEAWKEPMTIVSLLEMKTETGPGTMLRS